MRILLITCLLIGFGFTDKTFSKESYIGCYYYDLLNPNLGKYQNMKYVWALDEKGNYLSVNGYEEEQFFFLQDEKYKMTDITNLCEKSIPEGMEFYGAESFGHWYDFYPLVLGDDVLFKHKDVKMKKLILFGDSISDSGGLHKWARVVPTQVYWNSHFTNGWVWVQYLSKFLNNFPVLNWSYAGMKTSSFSVTETNKVGDAFMDFFQARLTGDFRTELEKYLSAVEGSKTIKDNLYFIWLGSNNYFNLLGNATHMRTIKKEWEENGVSTLAFSFADKATTDITEGAEKLINIGANKFFIIDLPDLGQLPLPFEGEYAMFMKNLSHLVDLHNDLLRRKISALKVKYNHVNFSILDAKAFIEEIKSKPTLYGVSNTKDACFTGNYFVGDKNQLCSNPNDYFFFDMAHPNSRIHCFIASKVHQIMYDEDLTKIAPHERAKIYDYCINESSRIYSLP